jgi:hypothetical protein
LQRKTGKAGIFGECDMQKQRSFGITLVVCGILLSITGCVEPAQKSKRVFLNVDFKQGQTLRYMFNSERTIITDWAPGKQDGKSKKKSTESVNMVVAYEPVEVDPYGLTKIKATFESVRARKVGGRGPQNDAVETLKGKSYSFTVGPDGRIHERDELVKVLTVASKAAFRQGGATKDPDLLDDVLVTQWYLWDSLSSIKKPTEGLKVGQTWKSHILIPTSMVLRIDRDVTYQLAEVRQTEQGQFAVIKSTYMMSEAKSEAPLPYEGSFRLSGTFGFFRAMFKGLSITSLEGGGEELFNIDAGRIDSSEQNYKFTLKPNAAPLPGASPIIYIDQKIIMKLIDN